ncbi:hypothetical protein HXX76_016012 [Chlamydomonas incerta]|uniref:Uncharacterized protein n=1 Tax=Chlamydomonas incerta TaxID=51695 RepID=A0A835VMJ4_CHLIN|nr:hypothetical protein HXX76_016012 [Chlamydomonas incerta]|eukprot:KAG2422442.1 hypothetical protein HXX76_016012 [Chlamydomonas incerta]
MFDDHGAGFAGHTWEFILGLSGMPSVLWQFLTDRKSRRTMLSWKDASEATLQPFTKRALEDVPIEVINSKSALLSPDQPTKELDWDNLHAALHKLPKGMPWAGPTNKGPGILLCGGALESWLRGKQANDIDLFIVMPGPIKPTKKTHQNMVNDVVLKTVHAIRAHQGSGCNIHVSKDKWHVVDIQAYCQGQPLVKYQIVTRVFASMAQVLEGFDIDSCRLGYNGTSVWAHQTALRAWKNGWNLFNACTLSNSALHRYSKKWLAGMGILFPGHSQEKLEHTIEFLATHDVRGCLPKKITELPLTIDGLLVFIKATGDDPSLLRSCMSDYDMEITNLPTTTSVRPCHSMVWDNKQVQLLEGPNLSPLFTCTHMYNNNDNNTECFRLHTSFGVCTDENGLFTGSFNPVNSNVYARLPWLVKYML